MIFFKFEFWLNYTKLLWKDILKKILTMVRNNLKRIEGFYHGVY
jgi:hypothetical protein